MSDLPDLRPTEVHVEPMTLDRFASLVREEAVTELATTQRRVRELLAGRTVWNVNSTAAGGGVAEMLQRLVAYGRGAGVDVRWLVLAGEGEFFRLTKRLHNRLHGSEGDGGGLGDAEREHYEKVLRRNAQELIGLIEPGDVVVLHDPQTAGLAAACREAGATTIWRSHIGTDVEGDEVREAWDFLRPYVEPAHAFVFTRQQYAPAWLDGRVHIIPPSIDPFSVKNEVLDPAVVHATVAHIGVVAGGNRHHRAVFERRDGTPGRVDRCADVVRAGPAPDLDVPMVLQVSRWDRLKDMQGVMQGFADQVVAEVDAHLVLVGPSVAGVSDDPEGAEVFLECLAAWQGLPLAARERIQLVTLPMDDVEENAAMVNALQRHAAVVVQKSLQEGFGLTVAEAMYKRRAVVASAIGGIQDQIDDGESGRLVADPSDLETFGRVLAELLRDDAERHRLGEAAHQRAVDRLLGNRHLLQFAELLEKLVEA